ncbi:uncharacterized protein TRIADDRAFT_61660 [Trichoplax adhaerens]|uniref:Histone-lysine N-methyltransferase n=1 Tax=Trichoplax adhaerens TaxID=10228 RepID=B3SBL7_TRIAD|nr:hypothetical protein TRIADDRAFT_61660 [Trichoplax adhaerens]EDV19881.1 hypothetical protein TRIADDRAFT_61660 [Trichoplax adhaerens]|eukprot:XP_002117623.1 hypothetical protein TRIADDRAFT_61660 [Trichoplax adhaerens]
MAYANLDGDNSVTSSTAVDDENRRFPRHQQDQNGSCNVVERKLNHSLARRKECSRFLHGIINNLQSEISQGSSSINYNRRNSFDSRYTSLRQKSSILCETRILAKWTNDIWYRVQYDGITQTEAGTQFKVRFSRSINYYGGAIILPGHHVACASRAEELFVGCRGVANYSQCGVYYGCIIVEKPCFNNGFRYLVFFDDGFAEYFPAKEIYRVIDAEGNDFWNDLKFEMREFVHRYLEIYPNIPMIDCKIGQKVILEREGKWLNAKIIDIDGNLLKIIFENDKRTEWVYRGSPRLRPLYDQLVECGGIYNLAKCITPSYRNGAYISPRQLLSSTKLTRIDQRDRVNSFEDDHNDLKPESKNSSNSLEYPSQCDEIGTGQFYVDEREIKRHNPLTIPKLFGWKRCSLTEDLLLDINFHLSNLKRDITEVEQYLRMTNTTNVCIDQFCFDPYVFACDSVIERSRPLSVNIPDITYGKERMPIACVNEANSELPNAFEYVTQRLYSDGVKIDLDEGFLLCCDCDDNCSDASKCICRQLTKVSFEAVTGRNGEHIGYHHRRLAERVISGIYECNNKCACSNSNQCYNRVIQNGVQVRMEVFNTNDPRGWGVRTIDCIPKGAFVSVYSGIILTDELANKKGLDHGDEYLINLDLIDSAERYKKDGYETEVNLGSDSQDSSGSYELISESTVSEYSSDNSSKILDLIPDDSGTDNTEIEESIELAYNVNDAEHCSTNDVPITVNDKLKNSVREVRRELRSYFNEIEPYTIDAKMFGNVSRFYNHSCNPNLFVQTVFADSHDLRFPWIAFFAANYIRAGTELTWDYGYKIGSVEGKQFVCHCKAKNCRGRLY